MLATVPTLTNGEPFPLHYSLDAPFTDVLEVGQAQKKQSLRPIVSGR